MKNIEVYGEMHRYIPVLVKNAGFKKIDESYREVQTTSLLPIIAPLSYSKTYHKTCHN